MFIDILLIVKYKSSLVIYGKEKHFFLIYSFFYLTIKITLILPGKGFLFLKKESFLSLEDFLVQGRLEVIKPSVALAVASKRQRGSSPPLGDFSRTFFNFYKIRLF